MRGWWWKLASASKHHKLQHTRSSPCIHTNIKDCQNTQSICYHALRKKDYTNVSMENTHLHKCTHLHPASPAGYYDPFSVLPLISKTHFGWCHAFGCILLMHAESHSSDVGRALAHANTHTGREDIGHINKSNIMHKDSWPGFSQSTLYSCCHL